MIDVGSNSVRLVVYEGGRRSPAIVFNEKVMCGLGARLSVSGALDPKGKERALVAIRRFAAVAGILHVGALAAVATAAVRDASDGEAFCAQVAAETGVRPVITSGADEARFAALGVIFGEPKADGVVVDLGGASLELCRITNGVPGLGVTTPLGPLRLAAGKRKKAFEAEISKCLEGLRDDFSLDGGCLYLVGGSWRALARAEIERSNYPLRVLHEFTLTAKKALALADWTAGASSDDIAALPGVPSGRVAQMGQVGVLLRHLIKALGPGKIKVSGFGLREGVCLEHMPAPVRTRDPLIAACDAQEALHARNPGLGPELAAWTKTVIPPIDATEERLIDAAARLVDVNWRNHPDYRVPGVWETVTLSTLTDLGHRGRAFVGTVLSIRYKRARKPLDQSRMPELLKAETIERAIRYGLVFRLGTVLSGAAPGMLRHCRVRYDGDQLELVLRGPAAELAGEEVEKRLRQLTTELGAESNLHVISE